MKVAGNNYYNFLSMLNIGGTWVIVNKLYAHIDD